MVASSASEEEAHNTTNAFTRDRDKYERQHQQAASTRNSCFHSPQSKNQAKLFIN